MEQILDKLITVVCAIIVAAGSFAIAGFQHKQKNLSDKLRRIGNKEVVIMEDYDGECHSHGVLDSLVGLEDDGGLRVVRDYETTRFVKGVIIPTVDSTETWITGKTSTIRKFEQILRRTDCNLYIFAKKAIPYGVKIAWKDYQNRLFYVGNIHRGIYQTIQTALPTILDEPLGAYYHDTPP